jgi:hypothetical protein
MSASDIPRFDLQGELAAVTALIAALRPNNAPTFHARQAEAINRLRSVQEYLDHPMAGLFLQNRDFDRRRAEAVREQRHRAWLRLNCLTDETALLFRGGVPPSGRDWAERVALFVRDRAAITTAEVIAGLGLNQTDQAAQTRVARILRAMGWRRRRTGKGATRRYVWCPELPLRTSSQTGVSPRGNCRTERTGPPESVKPAQQKSGHQTNGEARP